MAKAGVEATFPVVPVDIEDLQVSGFQSLSATFTTDEITALATMYRYAYESPGGSISVLRPTIGFPSPGRVSVAARLVYQGSGYDFSGSMDATIADGRLQFEPDGARLTAAGFDVRGERLEQAVRAVEVYVDELLDAVPRLTVVSAEIATDSVHIEGAVARRVLESSEE
jgi:hypothetical protein